MTSLVDADSLLVIDVGAVSTRASLFDVAAGRYRFVSQGVAPSTAGAPYRNIGEGVRLAIDQLQKFTGRVLVGPDEQLLIPTGTDGSGVDSFAATFSAGEPLKIVAVGLLEDVSLESARRLAAAAYGKVVQVFSLNDRRRTETRLNLLLRLRPHLIVMAGGTDQGASQSVMKLLEPIGLACYLLPQDLRPDVIFAGNQALREEIADSLEGVVQAHFTPNIRPELEVEQLDAAQVEMGKIVTRVRSRQLAGVEELNRWANGHLIPSSAAFGRIVRFLSKVHPGKKGVLGVDLGASATTVASAFNGELNIGVYPQLGLGTGVDGCLEMVQPKDVLGWLPFELSESQLREYILNKSLAPASLPATAEDLAIEQALARELLRAALRQAARSFPSGISGGQGGLLPWFDPVLATGAALVRAPSLAHSALLLLDGVQPTGVSTLVLDQNQIAPSLGAAALQNPILVAQVMDSNAFLNLGAVITPVCNVRPGTIILRIKMTRDDGEESQYEIKQGALEALPLPAGKAAKLQLQPLHRADVGMGAPGRGGSLRVTGGALGVIIDARGRPFQMPAEREKRQELTKKWLWSLGG